VTQLHVALLLARLDGKERLIAIVLACEQIPERVLTERLRPDPARAILRAVRRLQSDRMLEVDRGRLCLTNPESWPSHRLERSAFQRAGRLTGHVHDDVPAASTDQPKLDHAEKKAPTQKTHQFQLDDDLDWLDPPTPPVVDPVTPPIKPNLKMDYLPQGDECESCRNALALSSSPLKGLAMWAKQHLETCGRSPKARDGR
jgi:hypothetical protein